MSRSNLTSHGLATGVFDRVVDWARLAPSIHNTQPWAWFVDRGLLELWVDRSRSLIATDPVGRNLLISCGTALHHALFAARAMGLETAVRRLPEADSPDLLARVELRPGQPSASGLDDLQALRERCTDRRRFTAWPVARARVAGLADVAQSRVVRVVVIDEPAARRRLERLDYQAQASQLHDPEHPHRFDPVIEPVEPSLKSTDGILVLATSSDAPLEWLVTGETLSALWLHATREGLSVVPLSQVVDVPATRHLLRAELPDRSQEPQILVRIGWQQIGRSTLPRTPRRPLAEVLRRHA